MDDFIEELSEWNKYNKWKSSKTDPMPDETEFRLPEKLEEMSYVLENGHWDVWQNMDDTMRLLRLAAKSLREYEDLIAKDSQK